MTRYDIIEASRKARNGRDTTAAVPIREREPGDGVRMARAALAAMRKRDGGHGMMDREFRLALVRKLRAGTDPVPLDYYCFRR